MKTVVREGGYHFPSKIMHSPHRIEQRIRGYVTELEALTVKMPSSQGRKVERQAERCQELRSCIQLWLEALHARHIDHVIDVDLSATLARLNFS